MIPFGLKLTVFLVLLLGFTYHRVDGLCSVKHCTNSTRCLLSKDQMDCKCATGYYGDQCDKVLKWDKNGCEPPITMKKKYSGFTLHGCVSPCSLFVTRDSCCTVLATKPVKRDISQLFSQAESDAQIQVICDRNYLIIRAKEDFFKYHNVPLESLHLANKSCRAQRVVIGGTPYYSSRISKDLYATCGGKPLEKNFTHITYSLSLLSDPQVMGNIIRNPVIKMDYSCVYPYIRRVSLPFPVVPFSSETVMRVDELDAKIQMMLYTDQSYTMAYSNAPTIELRDKVYVEVTVTEPADFFLLRINECWATQSSQPKEGSFHTLLLNGCVDDQTVSFHNMSAGESGRNGESSTIRYSFDMFRFTGESHNLYLHCTVQLCEPDDYKSCKPNCNLITKREAVRGDPTNQGLLSYGPIRIEMPDRPHSSILTAVVVPVAAVWTVGFFLIILITVAKAGSRRLTQVEQHSQ